MYETRASLFHGHTVFLLLSEDTDLAHSPIFRLHHDYTVWAEVFFLQRLVPLCPGVDVLQFSECFLVVCSSSVSSTDWVCLWWLGNALRRGVKYTGVGNAWALEPDRPDHGPFSLTYQLCNAGPVFETGSSTWDKDHPPHPTATPAPCRGAMWI